MKSIRCPHCQKEIDSSILSEQVLDEERKKFQLELQEVRLAEKEKAEKRFAQELQEKLQLVEEEKKEERERREKLFDDLRKANEQVLKMKQKEEERELENQKKLLEERGKLKEEISKTIQEKAELEKAELRKQLDDTKKSLEEAQRKSSQISQQLQGEVLELQLEELLKETFAQDEIIAVKKGEHGADIRHIVKSPKGYICGVILWAFKRRKEWNDGWVEKLKEDMRSEGAHIPVIVTTVMPKEVAKLGTKNGVWITMQEFVVPLAQLLRKNLLDIAFQKAIAANRTEKADMLYSYITSHEFVQQVEAIVETYFSLKQQIDREKVAFEKQWKTREEQLDKLFRSTARMAGSIYGKAGSTMPQIKGLELLDDGN